MSKDQGDKVLSLTDASAGFVGAAFLYFIQKLPDTSDAKQILLYSMTVVALAANNVFSIVFGWGWRKIQHRSLKIQHKDLSTEYAEYKKNDDPDPEIMDGFNSAIKDTQLAILKNLSPNSAGAGPSVAQRKPVTRNRNTNPSKATTEFNNK
ncbi:hypothetical protein [Pseudomonas sp. MF6396]|uniref:hypothetical protein n=1 Tax=Pseudomonas sp. MF6396 TaxID=1960828 RepID=UPI00129053EF|nr:hypothetical protein [Pseudomonas sp. MF6396]